MTRMNTRVTAILAVVGTVASLSPAHGQTYTISSQSKSFSVPSGWPNVKYYQAVVGTGWKYAPPDVNVQAGTPLLLCTTGMHYSTDSKSCGDANNPSQTYGISSPPAIGIGVAFPLPGAMAGIQLMWGDGSCAPYSNQKGITNWWEYKITSYNSSSPAFLFAADVALVQGQGGAYYARLTNCSLTSSSTAK